jgi:hypothetical protein
VLDQAEIEQEILGGLPNEKDRLQEAYDQLQYSKAEFDEYPTRTRDGRWKSGSPRRTSPLFRRVVSILTANLYKSNPTRKLADPIATEWLAQTYKFSRMHAKWKRADELTLISGFCAFQFQGTTDPLNPIRVLLWGADEVVTWEDPDDPLTPYALSTSDRYDGMTRLRLWTKDQIVTYVTDKGHTHVAWGGTAFKEVNRKRNPYRTPEGEGILPFSFAHWETPTQTFTTNSPGRGLKECNHYVNEDLDKLGDAKNYLGRPIGVASGVDATWTPPVEIKPGDFMVIPAADIDAGGTGTQPTLSYLLPELGFIGADWNDLNFYIDHTLEMNGVPPVLIRMIQTSARSGESIKAEQTPLVTWVEGRRSAWTDYEDDAAKKCVEVTAAHLRANNVTADAARLQAIADDWEFTLRWPNLYTLTPGPERDLADDYRLERGYVSKVGIIMERDGLSEVEAVEHLVKVQEQNDTLESLGIDPAAPSKAPPGFEEEDQFDQEEQSEAEENKEEKEETGEAAA